jgi:hypothetical protein
MEVLGMLGTLRSDAPHFGVGDQDAPADADRSDPAGVDEPPEVPFGDR